MKSTDRRKSKQPTKERSVFIEFLEFSIFLRANLFLKEIGYLNKVIRAATRLISSTETTTSYNPANVPLLSLVNRVSDQRQLSTNGIIFLKGKQGGAKKRQRVVT